MIEKEKVQLRKARRKKRRNERMEGRRSRGAGLRRKKHEMKPRPPDCPGLCKQWERLFVLPECINSFTELLFNI